MSAIILVILRLARDGADDETPRITLVLYFVQYRLVLVYIIKLFPQTLHAKTYIVNIETRGWVCGVPRGS